ncbi:MAG: hypothetical protein IKU34_09880 [Clostridia bacterium]|nr:hypothetical protein [Clostridia bacterium]
MTMAAAQQYATEKKTPQKPAAKAPAQQKQPGAREKLHRLPMAAGIAAMTLLLVVSLFVGNFRALQIATPKAFLRQGDVQSIVEDRIAQAGNAVTVATRAGLDAQLILDVSDAMKGLEAAKTAREISRADQLLTSAVAELTTAQLSGEDAASMQRAADNFAEQGSFLRQEARAFNKKAEKAEAIYESLPTRFLFAEPDVYEGI